MPHYEHDHERNAEKIKIVCRCHGVAAFQCVHSRGAVRGLVCGAPVPSLHCVSTPAENIEPKFQFRSVIGPSMWRWLEAVAIELAIGLLAQMDVRSTDISIKE